MRVLPGCLALLLTCSARGDENLQWPQFRGPDANPVGKHKGLPERWSKTANVEWSAPIPGRGWSSPIVAGGRVFVTTVTTEGKSKPPQTGTDFSNEYAAELAKQGLSQAEIIERVSARDIEMPDEVKLRYFLYCLDLESGSVVWQREIHSGRPPGGRHRKNSFASETPVTDGEFVYVYVGNLGIWSYRFDGEPVWATRLEANPIYLEFGTGSSPVLHGNQLLILADNEKQQFLAAFDKRTGELQWRTNRNLQVANEPAKGSAWTTPFVWSNELRTEVVTVGPGSAVSYDLAGRELWRLSGMSGLPIPSPFAHAGLLHLNGGHTRAHFAVRAGGSGDISTSEEFVAWSAPRAGSYLPTPVAYQGGLYVLSEKGVLSRFDIRSGKLSYKTRIDAEAGAFTSSPWAYNGRIFCLNEEGKTFVVQAGETFRLLHANPLEEMAQATPAIVGDRLLIRTESRVYSIRQAP